MPVVSSKDASRRDTRTPAIRVGFVPLIDAGPLIAAAGLGYFADEGLDVHLEKQVGWGNVRDRLTYGELQASHAPIGMVPASLCGMEYYEEPLAMLMALGAGGNAITVSRQLAELGDAALAPARWRQRLGRPANLAYVFSVATHHYMWRRLLHDANVPVESDAKLCVLPPPQMMSLLQFETIDAYCVGEPWNTFATMRGCGTIFRATTELVPDHPEKVLAVTRRWLTRNPDFAERLIRAVVRGCDFCDAPANRSKLTALLARPEFLAMNEDVIARSLAIDEWLRPGIGRPRFRTFSRPATVPRPAAVEWVAREMIRWGQLPQTTDVARLALESIAGDAYDAAVADIASPTPRLSKQLV